MHMKIEIPDTAITKNASGIRNCLRLSIPKDVKSDQNRADLKGGAYPKTGR